MPHVLLTLEDDVSTDVIYPGRYMATVLPTETPQYAFADHEEFAARVKAGTVPHGSFVVAGRNFGCGSSREQAASALRGHDLVVVAKSFARIFLQNAINLGLQTAVCPTIEASVGDELELLDTELVNTTTGARFPTVPLPEARQAIVDAGGLIPYARRKLLARRQAG